LAGAKSQARTTYCLNNKRQLAAAWLMYAQDNRDYLAYNAWFGGTEAEMGVPNWMECGLDWSLNEKCTNLACLISETNASLAPYVSYVAAVFHCPEDTFLSLAQRAAGWTQRSRSVSMNWVMGDGIGNTGEMKSLAARGDYYAPGGANGYTSHLFIRLTDLKAIGPGMAWVFLDEHPDSMWQSPDFWPDYGPGIVFWRQLPANYHAGGCTFAFADGHAEYKKWLVPQTLAPVTYTDWVGSENIWWTDTSDRRDYDWLAQRTYEPSAFP